MQGRWGEGFGRVLVKTRRGLGPAWVSDAEMSVQGGKWPTLLAIKLRPSKVLGRDEHRGGWLEAHWTGCRAMKWLVVAQVSGPWPSLCSVTMPQFRWLLCSPLDSSNHVHVTVVIPREYAASLSVRSLLKRKA